MTINAGDLDSSTWLVVQVSVTVRVLPEVAVDTMHALLKVNVVEMNRLLELVSIIRRNDVSLRVKQIAFSISFEDFAKHPAVTMKVAKLSILQLAVEFWCPGLSQKVQVRPVPA